MAPLSTRDCGEIAEHARRDLGREPNPSGVLFDRTSADDGQAHQETGDSCLARPLPPRMLFLCAETIALRDTPSGFADASNRHSSRRRSASSPGRATPLRSQREPVFSRVPHIRGKGTRVQRNRPDRGASPHNGGPSEGAFSETAPMNDEMNARDVAPRLRDHLAPRRTGCGAEHTVQRSRPTRRRMSPPSRVSRSWKGLYRTADSGTLLDDEFTGRSSPAAATREGMSAGVM